MRSALLNLPLPTFRTSHPELQEQLGELRKHLLESTNDMTPLKVWEMQGDWQKCFYGSVIGFSYTLETLNKMVTNY